VIDEINEEEKRALFDELYVLEPSMKDVSTTDDFHDDKNYFISGDQSNKVIVLIEEDALPVHIGEYAFLEKVLSSVNLTMNEIGLCGGGSKAFLQLKSSLEEEKKILFCFGLKDLDPVMDPDGSKFGLSQISVHPSLNQIMTHVSLKQALWEALQKYIK
jgi:hypothetical protein